MGGARCIEKVSKSTGVAADGFVRGVRDTYALAFRMTG